VTCNRPAQPADAADSRLADLSQRSRTLNLFYSSRAQFLSPASDQSSNILACGVPKLKISRLRRAKTQIFSPRAQTFSRLRRQNSQILACGGPELKNSRLRRVEIIFTHCGGPELKNSRLRRARVQHVSPAAGKCSFLLALLVTCLLGVASVSRLASEQAENIGSCFRKKGENPPQCTHRSLFER
jgi:hypothetical protein